MLARREHSAFAVRRKLQQKGIAESDIVEAIERLQKEGLLSDQRYAESYINMRRGKGYGPLRIALELRERGVAESDFGSGFEITTRYRLFGSGDILITQKVVPVGVMPEWIPKAGLELLVSSQLELLRWYGRGPQETYPDRRSSGLVARWRSTVRPRRDWRRREEPEMTMGRPSARRAAARRRRIDRGGGG